MRAKKAKAIRRMVRRFAQEDVLMGDERTARYFWRRPDGLLAKSAGQQPPVDGAKPIRPRTPSPTGPVGSATYSG